MNTSGPAWNAMVNNRKQQQREINRGIQQDAYDTVLNPRIMIEKNNKTIGDDPVEKVDIGKISKKKMGRSNLLSGQRKKIFPRGYLKKLDLTVNKENLGGRRRKKTRRKRRKSKRRKRRKSKRKRRTKKKRKRRRRKTRK